MDQVTNIAFIRAKPGSSERLGQRLLNLVVPSRAEGGCINYDVHRSADDPNLWCVYENWRSEEDLSSHFQMPHMQEFVADLPGLVDGELDLRAFKMVSDWAHAKG
ncbi:putative quinol monooxygenase [Sinorhizobium medicae]|uniref:Antibiotic biosynthesis monooxygenase n=1 Tax=Sinorhizobium medicae TaxID=110321 RepID=A0A508WQ05_9HYPH|nr:putative quinol monooxygenase [Sinorhizobium medicae]VTZ59392.1 Antibiotic biosynthesis monooxygenase [Sinorhizobium medicae]